MRAKRVKKLDPTATLAENAARIVVVRIEELRSFAPQALRPERSTDQHDMRIAAKRLRYVLEATGFCFGKPADVVRRRSKELQDLLGEIHDCDVMHTRVDEHVRKLRAEDAAAVRDRAGDAADLDPSLSAEAPNRTAYRGLEVLAVHFQARRTLLFERFGELWARIERDAELDRLKGAAARRSAEARERRRAAEHGAAAVSGAA